MQINDSSRYLDGIVGAETAAQDHPLGDAVSAVGGLLGLRSRLLRAADSGAVASMDMPWTTATVPL
ncbi:hypothetical protein [Streptomyces sp. NPDC089919]|uniref:hypothetical protein n=1 Tax=Streptomyces sp. NPDC089919 TaxID=3155188 RepID=UPI003417ECEE